MPIQIARACAFFLGIVFSIALGPWSYAVDSRKCADRYASIPWEPPVVEGKKSIPAEIRLDPNKFKVRFPENWSFTALGPAKNGTSFWKIGKHSHVAFDYLPQLKKIRILGYSGSPKHAGQGTYLLTRIIENFPGYEFEATMAFKNDVELMNAFRDIGLHKKKNGKVDIDYANERLSKVPFVKALRGPYKLKTTILENGLPEFEIEYLSPKNYADLDPKAQLDTGASYFSDPKIETLMDRLLVEPDSTFAPQKDTVSFGIYENWLGDFPVEQKVIFKKP